MPKTEIVNNSGELLNARMHIRSINDSSRTNFSLRDVTKKIKSALSLEGEARDAAMNTLYKDMVKEAVTKGSMFYGLIVYYPEKAKGITVNNRSATHNTGNLISGLFNHICNENGWDYPCKLGMGMTAEEYRDFLKETVKPITVNVVRDQYMKVASNSYLLAELENIKNNLGVNTFSHDFKKSFNRGIADVYMNYIKKLEEKNSHGRIWRFFHPIENSRLNKFVDSSKEYLDRINFDFEKDAEAVAEYANNTIASPISEDIEFIDGNYDRMKMAEQQRNVVKLTVATDKYEAAVKREKELQPGVIPETSVLKKIEPVFNKYNAPLPKIRGGIVYRVSPGYERSIANAYDKRRTVNEVYEHIQGTYKGALNIFVDAAINSDKEIDFSELLKDVSSVTETVIENYTVIFDVPETKEHAKTVQFGNMNSEQILGLIRERFEKNGKLDRFDEEKMKADIEKARAEYKSPFLKEEAIEEINAEEVRQSIVIEDLGEKPVEVSQPNVGTEINAPNLQNSI